MSMIEKINRSFNIMVGFSVSFSILIIFGILLIRFIKSNIGNRFINVLFKLFGLTEEELRSPGGTLLALPVLIFIVPISIAVLFGAVYIGDSISSLLV